MIARYKTYPLPSRGWTRWVTYPGKSVSAEIRCMLIGRLFGTLPVFSAGAVNTVLVSAVIAGREQSVAFYVWAGFELAIAIARLSILVLARRSSEKVSVLTDIHIALSICWSASVGYGVFISIIAGDWVAATLSCLSAAAMVGGVCFRSFSAPRLVCCQIGLMLAPLWIGSAFSGEAVLYAVFIQGPMYLAAMAAAAFQLNQMLIATMRAKQESEYGATHDALTGLLNRAGLREFSEHLESTVARKAGVLFIDLDEFKLVNDTRGHTAGDCVLKTLSRRLLSVLPKNAGGARIGGDEFVVVVAPVSTSSLYELADRVRDVLSKPYSLDADVEILVTSSVGAAASEYSGESLSDLLDRADRASYEMKYARKARSSSEQVITNLKRLNESFNSNCLTDLAKAS